MYIEKLLKENRNSTLMLKLYDAHWCLVIANLNTNLRAGAVPVVYCGINFIPRQEFVIHLVSGDGEFYSGFCENFNFPRACPLALHPTLGPLIDA